MFYFIISFFILAFAQPDWSIIACVAASCIGYALFWKGMLDLKSLKARFLAAVFWFALIQWIHLSWLTSDHYVGKAIFLFLLIWTLVLGVQFGIISCLIKDLTLFKILGISGVWALFEWGRLHFLSGYSWNPVGLSLSSTLFGLQMASFLGVFGMSFLVIFTNLLALGMLKAFSWRRFSLWGSVALLPYCLGAIHVTFHQGQMKKFPETLSTLLVQTSLSPEEKFPLNGSAPLPPHIQWERILSLVLPYLEAQPDLMIFSEAVVPYGASLPVYPIDLVEHAFEAFFEGKNALPKTSDQYVSNSYWAQALSNQFSSDVIIGLEDYVHGFDGLPKQAYNAAFLFRPYANKSERYEKRVLVPMGEYIPFTWCRKFLKKYGIEDSFTPGKEAKVFDLSRANVGLSICYEETYGHLMRQSCLKGSSLLINLTNDGWYPRSRLPIVHFLHGRLRAVEGGVPLLRCCNTGVTCGVDSLGKIVKMLDYESAKNESPAAALSLLLPLYHYPTFYTRFGDLPIVLFSAFCLFLYCLAILKPFKIKELDVSPLRKNKA